MTVSLNYSRGYAEIFGQLHGAMYSQMYKGVEIYFDQDGDLIPGHPLYDAKAKEIVELLLKRDAERAKDEDAEQDGPIEVDPMDGLDEDAPRPARGKSRQAQSPKTTKGIGKTNIKSSSKIDLRGWALGHRREAFPAVRQQIKRDFNFVATDRRSAINFLINEGVVKKSDLAKGG